MLARRWVAALAIAVVVFGGAGVSTVMASSGTALVAPPAAGVAAAHEPAPPARPEPVYPAGESGAAEVRRWVEQDRSAPPPADAVLFIGSSSIRRWESLSRDLPEYDVVQRGWGGSVMPQILAESPWLIAPTQPAVVVLRTGLNDLRSGASVEQLLEQVRSFVAGTRESRVDTEVLVLAIAPTPATIDSPGVEQQRREANRLLAAEAAVDPAVRYVDIATPFEQLAASDPAAFARTSIDGLHLTPAGYAVWTAALRPVLAAVADPVAPQRPAVQGLRAGDRMLLDLGPDDGAAGRATSVDPAGLHWNDWWPTAGGAQVVAGEHRSGLVTTEGRETGVSMTVTGGFRANSASAPGLLDPDARQLGDLAVPSTTGDYWSSTADDRPGGDDDLPGGFMLAGLDPELRYGFRFLGAADGAPRAVTEYAVHGVERRAATLRTGQGRAPTEPRIATVDDVVPDARGRVWVDATLLEGTASHLNAVEVTAVEVTAAD